MTALASPNVPASRQTDLDTPPAPGAGRTRQPGRSRRRHRQSFGSVRQLPSGRWQARYSVEDGSRYTAPHTFATKRAAEDWLATARADLVRGTWRAPNLGTVTLASYASNWLATRVDLAPSTRALYERLLRVWVLAPLTLPPAGGKPARTIELGRCQLRAISLPLVREWHAAAVHTAREQSAARVAGQRRRVRQDAARHAREWAQAHGYRVAETGRLPLEVLDAWKRAGEPAARLHTSAAAALLDGAERPLDHRDEARGRPAVVPQAYRLLHTVMQTALVDGLIEANPCQLSGAGRARSRPRIPATPAQVQELAQAMPERYAAAVHVAAWSGLRAGELFGLARRHVDLVHGTVRVERTLVELPGQGITLGPPKTEAGRRTVHLPDHVVELLRTHLDGFTPPGPDALVFCTSNATPLRGINRTTMFRRAAIKIGRPDLRWHDLRHTGATMAAQAGASIRELQHRLGHASVAAAMIYQHADAERDRSLAQRMGEMAAAAHTDRAGSPR